jgi:hypothetical protein
MQGAIFNDQCHLYGPEAQRILEEEIAHYRSLAEKESPDLLNEGYFNRFNPVKKARGSVCDGFIPNYVRLLISCARGGECPAFCQRPK